MNKRDFSMSLLDPQTWFIVAYVVAVLLLAGTMRKSGSEDKGQASSISLND